MKLAFPNCKSHALGAGYRNSTDATGNTQGCFEEEKESKTKNESSEF